MYSAIIASLGLFISMLAFIMAVGAFHKAYKLQLRLERDWDLLVNQHKKVQKVRTHRPRMNKCPVCTSNVEDIVVGKAGDATELRQQCRCCGWSQYVLAV